MAWNPSPEVKLARDASASMGRLIGRPVDQCVVFYRAGDWLGYASYGVNKSQCQEAREEGDKIYDRVCRIVAGVEE